MCLVYPGGRNSACQVLWAMADLEGLNMDQLRARLDAGTNARREALHHAGAAYADVSAAAERQRLRMTVERQMRGTERLQEVTRQT